MTIYNTGTDYISADRETIKFKEIVVDEYKDGHVVLDFVDTKQNEMIWQGGVTGTLTDSQKKMEKRINTVFGLLFKKFPLKAN